MNLLFVADNAYRDNIFTCISSIIRFPQEEGYDIYIMQSDWDDIGKKEVSDLVGAGGRIHFIYIDTAVFDEFPRTTRYPNIIYYRILASKFLPENVDRILYLDGDIIVINSLEELYNTEFDGNLFCACTHVKSFLTKFNQYRLGVKEERPYINSGVLLPDQDIISALYGNRIKLIDTMKYNLSDRMLNIYNTSVINDRIDLDWVRENSVIIHYYGRNKPWGEHYSGILDVFYHEVAESDTYINIA